MHLVGSSCVCAFLLYCVQNSKAVRLLNDDYYGPINEVDGTPLEYQDLYENGDEEVKYATAWGRNKRSYDYYGSSSAESDENSYGYYPKPTQYYYIQYWNPSPSGHDNHGYWPPGHSEQHNKDHHGGSNHHKNDFSDIKKMRRKRNILSVDDVEDEESDAVFPTRPIFVSKAQQQKPVAVALTIDSSNIPKVKDNKASIYYNKDTIQATIIPSVSYEVPTQNQFIENQSVQSRPTPSNNYDSSYHYQHYDYNRFYPPPPPPHYGHPPPPHHGHHPPSYHGHHPRPPPYYGYYPPPPPPHHGHYPPSPPPYDSYPPPPPPPPPPSYYPPPPQTSYYYYDSGNNSDQMGNNAGKDISEKIDNIFGNHFETTTDLSSLVDIRGNK